MRWHCRAGVFEKSGPDVAQQRGHSRRVSVRRCARERRVARARPRRAAVRAERLDACPPQTVDATFATRRAEGQATNRATVAHEKRVAPRDRVRRWRSCAASTSPRRNDSLTASARQRRRALARTSGMEASGGEQSERIGSRRLQDSEETPKPGSIIAPCPAIENSANSDVAHRSSRYAHPPSRDRSVGQRAQRNRGMRRRCPILQQRTPRPPVASKTVTRYRSAPAT